jgi:hypothetical protein
MCGGSWGAKIVRGQELGIDGWSVEQGARGRELHSVIAKARKVSRRVAELQSCKGCAKGKGASGKIGGGGEAGFGRGVRNLAQQRLHDEV